MDLCWFPLISIIPEYPVCPVNNARQFASARRLLTINAEDLTAMNSKEPPVTPLSVAHISTYKITAVLRSSHLLLA